MVSRIWRTCLVLFLVVIALPVTSVSAQYTSPNYEVDEIFIGGGGEIDTCSTNFCSDQSAGGTAVGNTSSTGFQADGGFGTPDEAYIEIVVSNFTINLGDLTVSATAAASSNFSVKNYLTNGYIVKIYGDSPTNVSPPGTESLNPLATPTTSQIGVEQFGINLVANTTPGIGANPTQTPDATFSFGEAAPGYNIVDQFQYIDGDTIALSDNESGITEYTLSMIANISTSTTGGRYNTTLVIQALPTY
jgi:hypothetical protein